MLTNIPISMQVYWIFVLASNRAIDRDFLQFQRLLTCQGTLYTGKTSGSREILVHYIEQAALAKQG